MSLNDSTLHTRLNTESNSQTLYLFNYNVCKHQNVSHIFVEGIIKDQIYLKGPHIYVSTFVQKDYHQFNANFIDITISTFLMINLSMMVASIQDEIKLHYKYKISYDKTQIAKQKVIEHLFDSHEKIFEKLICLK